MNLKQSLIIILFIMPQFVSAQHKYSGESLKFSISSVNLPVGSLRLRISDIRQENLSEYYILTAHAKTSMYLSMLFAVNNTYESSFHVSSFLPKNLKKSIDQKNIEQELEIRFDQIHHTASTSDTKMWTIPDSCHNFFSMLYFLRNVSIDSADTMQFHLDSESVTSRAIITSAGKKTISSKLGDLLSYGFHLRFEPVANIQRMWKTDIMTNRLAQPDSEMTIWFSDDAWRIPLRIHFIQKSFDIELNIQSADM